MKEKALADPQYVWDPVILVLFNLLIPGSAAISRGEFSLGIKWLAVVAFSYVIFWPIGVVFHFLTILSEVVRPIPA
jgi:hypothetical protein